MKNRAWSFLKILPECYLLLMLLLASYSPPFQFNYLFLILAVFPLVQILIRNRYLGLSLGFILFLTNLFFLGAVLSEFHEFPEFSLSAVKLIAAGTLIWFANLFASLMMIYKSYSPNLRASNPEGKIA